jgi:hypothetical protein
MSSALPLYQPLRLGELPPAECVELVQQALNGNLALYVGAGASRGAPSNLPLSDEVVSNLAQRAELELGIEPLMTDGKPKTLEQLADNADANGALPALKQLAVDVAPFTTVRANYAHRVLAALLREGLVRVFCVNWDLGIEHGGAALGFHLSPAVTDADSLSATGPAYRKVHGCATRPQTLIITTAEVDAPPPWAVAEVQAALSGGFVVFVGLGTVGDYVATRVKHVIQVAGPQVTIRVVGTSLSLAWKAILQNASRQQFITATADSFLDDMLRALVRMALAQVSVQATVLQAAGAPSHSEIGRGAEQLVAVLDQGDALSVTRWLRDGAQGVAPGTPVVSSNEARTALATLAGVIGGRNASVRGSDSAMVVELDAYYVEVTVSPGQVASLLIRAQMMRIAERRAAGLYLDLAKPIVNICVGHMGTLPTAEVVQDIVSTHPVADLIAGPSDATHLWLSGDQFVQGAVNVP